jgi:hypothetical protein
MDIGELKTLLDSYRDDVRLVEAQAIHWRNVAILLADAANTQSGEQYWTAEELAEVEAANHNIEVEDHEGGLKVTLN